MAKPFFKWAGGKAKLLPQLLPLLPGDVDGRRHVEPFLGGGALFFAREPKHALLADQNIALVSAYVAVSRDPYEVGRKTQHLLKKHTEAAYYRARKKFNKIRQENGYYVLDLASLFLYLNRTCFNGLYRENPRGEFNVPVGSYKNPTCDVEELVDARRVLLGGDVVVENNPWSSTLAQTRSTDFVYIDPPYDEGFTAYTKDGFDRDAQEDLATMFRYLDKVVFGVKLMLSNSDTPLIRELYSGFDIQTIQAPRAINSKASGRGSVSEVVVRNYS